MESVVFTSVFDDISSMNEKAVDIPTIYIAYIRKKYSKYFMEEQYYIYTTLVFLIKLRVWKPFIPTFTL